MAGRIRDEDVALVRERASIDDVVREYVTLKTAGGGSLKGLCPFHDEKSPSFHVTPSRGMWYCFGCGEGGDVINFVQRMDHLSFAETIEKLAEKTGVQLRYVDGGAAINNLIQEVQVAIQRGNSLLNATAHGRRKKSIHLKKLKFHKKTSDFEENEMKQIKNR